MGCETFYCSCGQDFDERPLLEIHKHKCPTIKEFYKIDGDKNSEMTEMKENKPPIVDQFKCDKCDKVFSKSKYLRQHNRNLHQKQHRLNQFECDKCDRAFNYRKGLSTHISNVHPKYLHTCGTCDKTFKTKGTLKRHKIIHMEEKPFSCEICGKGFTQKSNMKIHQNSGRCHL